MEGKPNMELKESTEKHIIEPLKKIDINSDPQEIEEEIKKIVAWDLKDCYVEFQPDVLNEYYTDELKENQKIKHFQKHPDALNKTALLDNKMSDCEGCGRPETCGEKWMDALFEIYKGCEWNVHSSDNAKRKEENRYQFYDQICPGLNKIQAWVLYEGKNWRDLDKDIYDSVYQYARLRHTIGNFSPTPDLPGSEQEKDLRGKIFNSHKGSGKSTDFLPVFIEYIQDVKDGTREKCEKKAAIYQYWHQQLIDNREKWLLEDYYIVTSDNRLIGIPLFEKQNIDHPRPDNDTEIIQCIDEMNRRIIRRGLRMAAKVNPAIEETVKTMLDKEKYQDKELSHPDWLKDWAKDRKAPLYKAKSEGV